MDKPSAGFEQISLLPERDALTRGRRFVHPAPRSLTITALFAGVGGLERGLHKAGHRTLLFCEKDPEAAAVLRRRFPSAPIVDDVRKRAEIVEHSADVADLVTGGFPCTDLSQAGKTQGFGGVNSSLVREVFGLLRARPFKHVLLENVPNWRVLHGGAYLEEVVSTLERLGYRWAYRTIDARAFGTPQRRLRVFLYASLEDDPRDILFHGDEEVPDDEFALDEAAHGFYWTEGSKGLGWGEDCVPTLKGGSGLGIPSPPAILRTNGLIVTPHIEDAEALQGFPRKWTHAHEAIDDVGPRPFRQKRRWMLVGNAINVRVAEWLGQKLRRPIRYSGADGTVLKRGSGFPACAWFDGTRRFSIPLSSWPVADAREPLESFLRHPGTELSLKATEGFYRRISSGSLRRRPDFLAAVKKHRERMSKACD